MGEGRIRAPLKTPAWEASRALDCRAEGRRFDSRARTKTQGLKITEK